MPDPNKLEALEKSAFRIREVCGGCVFSKFTEGSPFGTCSKIHYMHAKHTGPEREASIHIFGWCPTFMFDAGTLRRIEASGMRKFIVSEEPTDEHD